MTSIPCGPPKPRKAVCEVLCVRATRPVTRTWGIQYALSTWHSARVITGSDRSRLQPPSEVSVASSASRRPSSSKAARHRVWKPCRLPVIVMSCARLSRSRTGRPVSVAPRAATAARPCGCISLPPNPPPIRRHCTVTALLGRPSTWATTSWVSLGCWVLHCTKTWPLSSTWASEQCVSR